MLIFSYFTDLWCAINPFRSFITKCQESSGAVLSDAPKPQKVSRMKRKFRYISANSVCCGNSKLGSEFFFWSFVL